MFHGNARSSGGHGRSNRGPQPHPLDLSGVVLKPTGGAHLSPELFDGTACALAKAIGETGNANKPTQIRQFYDELVMWEERARQSPPERFEEFLPFIRMLNAKAAYAKGRGHIDDKFVSMISHCLSQVDSARTLRNFKLFFEAFLGYYKLYGPRG